MAMALVVGALGNDVSAAGLVPLGAAGGFGVLANTTVTNTGATVVNGDLGLTPGVAVTGFPPGTVVGGAIHINDAPAVAAKTAAQAAFTALNALPCDFTYGAGQDLTLLSPMTPAVRCFTSSALMTGPVVLNAAAGQDFVFKIASSLTVSNNATMTIGGGATACDVSWGAGSSATLGTNSSLLGNILAFASVTLGTSANLSGGAYALNGAVTLDTNSVQACGSPASATSKSIPTLSEWGMILLAGILALVGLAAVRKRNGELPN